MAAPGRGPYAVALLDWLACAAAGAGERAALAVRETSEGLLGDVAFAATAGHVLDFDDTFPYGVAHLSATCAPAALVLAAHLGRTLGEALAAYAAAFEAAGAFAEASHPALYDRGWHPTAVCGPVGGAVAACQLLGIDGEARERALAASLLRAGGSRGAFGSDGKAIQVGQAAAAGVEGALLARAGAAVDLRAVGGDYGLEAVTGAALRAPDPLRPAIARNWIKLHPSCLGTHAPIDLALDLAGELGPQDGVCVQVNPLAVRAAHISLPRDGLQAKFSIPWCVAFAVMRGAPRIGDFAAVRESDLDAEVLARAARIEVAEDASLEPWGAAISLDGRERARVPCPRGAPERPAGTDELAAKLHDLAGHALDGLLADLDAPAAAALRAAGLTRLR